MAMVVVAAQRSGLTVYRALVGRPCHSRRALIAQKTVVVTSWLHMCTGTAGRDGSSAFRFRPVAAAFAEADKGTASLEF